MAQVLSVAINFVRSRRRIVDPREIRYTCFVPPTLTELKQVIDSGDFNKLISEVESQVFDAKGQPYQLENGPTAKREFSKDVAAFANSRGGCIFIGMRTEKDPLYNGEKIVEVRPIPQAKFDPSQYQKVLAEWLHPQPKGVEIRCVPFGEDPTKGVGVIFVPVQDDRTKPFLIKRVIGENEKSSELMIGYVERRIDETQVRTVEELHHALKLGFDFEREILGRIANLESLIERHFSATTAAKSEQREETLKERIGRMTDAAEDMKEQRNIILSVMPTEDTELRSIFSDRPNSIRRQLEEPQPLRTNGWDLRTGGQAKFIGGELIRVEGYRSIIDLYRDGTFIFGGLIHRNFLAWSDEADAQLHPLALAEVVINFAQFYKLVLDDCRISPSHLEFRVDLRNLWLGKNKTYLPAGPVLDHAWGWSNKPKREAPESTWSHTFQVSSSEYNYERIAFRLIHEMYIWFGHSEESIPYRKETDTGPAIDADAIANIH